VTDNDVKRVREAGYTDGEIAEIVANVALNIFTNYFDHVAQTGVDFPKIELGLKQVHQGSRRAERGDLRCCESPIDRSGFINSGSSEWKTRLEKQAYIVTGATGNIGKALAERLLAHGKKVRVIGRNEERLKPLVDKGAEPFVGSLDGATFLTNAFQDARVVFSMIPPNFTATDFRVYQNQKGLHDNEQRLNRLDGVNVVHLRPGFFMENLRGGQRLADSRTISIW